MAASDPQQAQAVQRATDGKWVILEGDGEAVKEQLLEEQDGYARGEKESIHYTSEAQESAQDTESSWWWYCSAWNDVPVNSALWDDMRPYVAIAALSVYAVLQALAALASLAECNTLHALFISLKHFTAATLIAAVLSVATRFISLTAVKASTVKKPKLRSLLCDMQGTNVLLIPAACFTSTYEIGAGITVFQEARREEDFGWFLQLLADMARVHVLTAAIVLSSSLVFLMGTDLVATHRAVVLHYRLTKEYRKPAARRSLELRAKQKPPLRPRMIAICVAVCGVMLAIIVDGLCLFCSATFAHLGHAHSAASGGI